MKIKLLVLLCLIPLLSYSDSVSIYIENDFLEKNPNDGNGVSDGYYTAGEQIKYENDNNWGLKIASQIYTPSDKDSDQPEYGDRPYGSWSHCEYFKKIYKENYEQVFEIGIGLVGPDSGGEWLQTEFHKLINSAPPMGWKYQLNNEPTLQLAYYRTYSIFLNKYLEFRPYAGANVGNALINVELGNIVRCGYNIPKNFDPVIRLFKVENKSFWDNTYGYVFIGGKVYGVAHNIFLQGNTFSDNIVTVTPENVVGDGLGGVCIGIYRFEATITHVERTHEFRTQNRPERFDSIQFCYKF